MIFNEADVRKFYRWLGHRPEEFTEIRIIPWPSGPIIQKWVQNEKEFIKICKKWSGKHQVYAGINPRSREGGSKEDISRVTGIPFDIDSKHPKNEAATNEELAKAKERMIKLNSWIRMQKYQQSLVSMSGNGFHIIQKVDLPITNDLSEKLEAYFHEAPTEGLDSIFDLPRIIKVPGTMSVKGISTKERPRRLSYIVNEGDPNIDVALVQHIQSLEPYKPIITTIIEKEKKRKTSKLRPCFKRFVEEGGVISEIRSEDHLLRLALVQEAHASGYNPNQIISLFEKAEDFNLKKTKKAVNDELKVIMKKGARPWRCIKIYNHKGCLGETCPIYKRQIAKYLPKEDLKPGDPLRFFETDEKGNKKSFMPTWLGDEILEDRMFAATSEKSVIWTYNQKKGIWEDDGEKIIRKKATEKLEHLYKSFFVSEVISYIRDSNYIDQKLFEGPPEKIVMKNGVYDLLTDEFTVFNPELYAITAIPVTYDPEAECPKILKFLSEISPNNIPKLIEYPGYCLYKSFPVARVIILVGEGGGGKSTYLRMITSFLGKENVSSVTLQKIAEGGFRNAELYGKLANLAADIPAKPIKDTGPIKMLTGGDLITIEKKYHDPFQYYNHAKPAFSANKIPPSWDQTIAYHRRMITIPFDNKFLREDPKTDIHILEKITVPEELSGFFNLTVQGLKKFLKQKGFTGEPTAEARKIDYIRRSDLVQYFAIIYVERAPDHWISKAQLYDHYVYLCQKFNETPIANTWFSRNVRRFLPYVFEGQDTTSKDKVWRGIRVKLELLDELETVSTASTVFPVSNNLQDIRKYLYSIYNSNSRENTVYTVDAVSKTVEAEKKKVVPTVPGNIRKGRAAPTVSSRTVPISRITFKQVRPAEKCGCCFKAPVEYDIFYPGDVKVRRCKDCFEKDRRISTVMWEPKDEEN